MLSEAEHYKKNWQSAQKELRQKEKNCAFVYVHLEADTGNPFYVGIGVNENRPWNKTHRTNKHKNRINKHGMRVEIITQKISWENAKLWEICWIKNLRDGGFNLVNLTDGGDGTTGYVRTEEERLKIKEVNNRPEIKKIHRENMLGDKNPMKNPDTAEIVAQKNRGRKRSQKFREDASARRTGVPLKEETIQNMKKGQKLRWQSKTNEEKKIYGDKIKNGHQKRSSEDRKETIKLAWETRRKRKAKKEGVSYESLLPKPKVKISREEKIKILKEIASRPEVKRKQSEKRKLAWENKEYRKAASSGVALTWKNVLIRQKRIDGILKSRENGEFGKQVSIRNFDDWSDPFERQKRIDGMKKAWSDPSKTMRRVFASWDKSNRWVLKNLYWGA